MNESRADIFDRGAGGDSTAGAALCREPPEGNRQWRSLDRDAESSALRAAVAREFPQEVVFWEDETSRRRFLQVMGASLALAGLQGCGGEAPHEKIVPYVRTPETSVPGRAISYATAASLDGFATGILAESHDGRPTKIEGNPDHPANPGGTGDVFLQAEILELYDPDRMQAVTSGGGIAGWTAFLDDLASQLAIQRGRNGGGLRILSQPTSSPSLLALRERLLETLPEAKWVEYSTVDRSGVTAGTERLFGEALEPRYDFARADVVLALDADPFAATMPEHLRHTRGVALRRLTTIGDVPWMTRLYAVETTLTLFGAKADHRRGVDPAGLVLVARAIARRVGVELPGDEEPLPEGFDEAFVAAVADDLRKYRRPEGDDSEPGGPLVVAGETQSAEVHALAHAMNAALGAVGTTVSYHPRITGANGFGPLRELVEEMRAGNVDTLLILGANPVYGAPGDLEFAEALEEVEWRAAWALHANETTAACHWQLPATHFLEEWGDARALDGTVSIVQPLIRPLYDGRSQLEVVSALVDDAPRTGYEIVREHWRGELGGDDFETAWRTALDRGVVEATAFEPASVEAAGDAFGESFEDGFADARESGGGNGFAVVFRPDPHLYDGRYANNAWLQELPKPFTTLTWDNAALLAPVDAERLGIEDGDLVRVSVDDRAIEIPALRVPGIPRGTVSLHLGHGRRRAGRVGKGVGTDVSVLRTSDDPWFASGAEVRPVGGRRRLAVTQLHHLLSHVPPHSFVTESIEHRNVVRSGTLEELREHPDDPAFMHAGHHGAPETPHAEAGQSGHPTEETKPAGRHEQPSFFPVEERRDYEPHEWGMAIDLMRCIGCNACTIACQSENNIPVVGRDQVLVGREMHWIRVDTYYEGDDSNPRVAHQPVPCMHCEHAPCEPVCPVAATTHSDEGLNEMTYNRCVGTRYCSNNCPYKVRRFNFLEFHANYGTSDLPVLDLLPNPDVTVRSRGVMEKCTYCVQRISEARIDAQIHGDGVIPDDPAQGGVVTACQQVCPAEAIVFGNIADPNSAVSRAKASPLDYVLLEELNTRPRTSYGAALRNPHPELERSEIRASAGGR